MTNALSLPVEHRPQTTRLHPALSCAASSIFLQLYLKPAVHISFSRSRLHVFFGRPLTLWPCAVHWQCCHHSFGACDQASSTFFFAAEPTPVPGRSSSIVPCWIFCLTSGCLRFFILYYPCISLVSACTFDTGGHRKMRGRYFSKLYRYMALSLILT